MFLESMTVGEQCPTVTDVMDSPLAKYINIVTNNCGHSGTAEKLIENYAHLLFLKAN